MDTYKHKYLKYKNKYLTLKKEMLKNKQIGGAPEFITLPAGSLLYRAAPDIMTIETTAGRIANSRVCSDTDKTGLYLANQLIISLGMCIEYNKLMELGIFRITKDIENVSVGKYSYREINPDRYFNPDGTPKNFVYPIPEENISHIGCNLNVLDNNNRFLLPSHIQDGLNCLESCEIFLSTLDPEHLNSIELIQAFRFNPAIIKTANDLHQYMIREHFPFDIEKYVGDNILIPFY